MIEAILFDLDGTIHDSRDVVFDCVERTFNEFECAAPGREAIVAQVHAGSAHLFDQLAPKTHTQEMLQYFRDLYKTEQNKIQPYVADNCQAELVIIPSQGHFNLEKSENYRQFPKLLECMAQKGIL